MALYLMTEKTKTAVNNLIAQNSLDITGPRRRSRSSWTRPATQSVYDGPFAVSKKDDSTVSILAGNIIHGIDKIAVAETDLAVSSSGIIYIELTYPSGTAATEFKTAAEMPTLEAGKYQKKLANVIVEDSKITSVTQVWKSDDIEVVGRL